MDGRWIFLLTLMAFGLLMIPVILVLARREGRDREAQLNADKRAIDVSEVFDDFSSWANVKPGDNVTVLVNGKEVITSLVYKDGTMGLLKQRTLDKLKQEGTRQLVQGQNEMP